MHETTKLDTPHQAKRHWKPTDPKCGPEKMAPADYKTLRVLEPTGLPADEPEKVEELQAAMFSFDVAFDTPAPPGTKPVGAPKLRARVSKKPAPRRAGQRAPDEPAPATVRNIGKGGQGRKHHEAKRMAEQ